MSRIKLWRIILTSLLLFMFILYAFYVYLALSPYTKTILGKPIIWWLAFIPGIVLLSLLLLITIWIFYIVLTTKEQASIENEIERIRKKKKH